MPDSKVPELVPRSNITVLGRAWLLLGLLASLALGGCAGVMASPPTTPRAVTVAPTASSATPLPTPKHTPTPTPAPTLAPIPGQARPLDWTNCPPGYLIKGVYRNHIGQGSYFVPGDASHPFVGTTTCFATQADAQAAGFSRATR